MTLTAEDIELIEHKRWIDSLDPSDRRRQLYYSEKDDWMFYHPQAGWAVGGPCDAETALFLLGYPLVLGEPAPDLDMPKLVASAKRILKEWTGE